MFCYAMTSWNFTYSKTSSFISVHVVICFVYDSKDISFDHEGTFAGLVNLLTLPPAATPAVKSAEAVKAVKPEKVSLIEVTKDVMFSV